jgi:nitroimidazol reductase NimA-like FMN-containing flavoprotein (pyridoxamine 5'-phosphate oxidase superfamily)
MKGILSSAETDSILLSRVIGRLACCDGTQPYIVPITYKYLDGYIYGQSNEGTKLNILRQNPKVAFEVDMMTDLNNWRSVVVTGEFEEMTDKETEESRSILFNDIFSLMTGCSIHPHEHAITEKLTDESRIKCVVFRIKIKEISGRYEKQ